MSASYVPSCKGKNINCGKVFMYLKKKKRSPIIFCFEQYISVMGSANEESSFYRVNFYSSYKKRCFLLTSNCLSISTCNSESMIAFIGYFPQLTPHGEESIKLCK